MLSATRHVLDQNTGTFGASVFDDLAYLVLHELREIYDGTGEEEVDGLQKETGVMSFKASAFYQALKSDMRGVKYPTSSHYKRAGERMWDLPEALTDDEYSVEKIIMCLETIGVDAESFKSRQTRERQTSFKRSVGVATQSVEDFMRSDLKPKNVV